MEHRHRTVLYHQTPVIPGPASSSPDAPALARSKKRGRMAVKFCESPWPDSRLRIQI